MYRLPLRILPAASLLAPGQGDIVSPTEKAMREEMEINKYEIPVMDRLKNIFFLDDHGYYSAEYSYISNATFMGLFGGAIFGGVMRSRISYIDFIEKNKATAFQSHFEAKRALSNTIYTSFGRGAFSSAWRLGLFTFIYATCTTVISVIRQKDGILEYVGGGAICGTLFRLHLGLPGIAVGCGLGATLGFLAGALRASMLWLTGMDMNEVRNFHHKWHKFRTDAEKRDIGQFNREQSMQALLLEKAEKEMAGGVGLDKLGMLETDAVSQHGSESISSPVNDKTQNQDNKIATTSSNEAGTSA